MLYRLIKTPEYEESLEEETLRSKVQIAIGWKGLNLSVILGIANIWKVMFGS